MILPDLLARRAALTPQAVALRSLVDGQSLDYRTLHEHASRAATLLTRRGVTEGDRVAVLCRNRIEFFELLFACARVGAMLVPLNWRMPVSEMAVLLADAAPSLVAWGAEDAHLVHELALDARALLALDDGAGGYARERDDNPPLSRCRDWPAEQCWYLIYTSGTTGRPKGVMCTYGMSLANYLNIRQGMGIGAGDVTLNYLPLCHTAGLNLVTLPTLLEGGCALILPQFDVERVIGLLARGALDTFFGVPAVYQQLSLHAAFDDLDLARPRAWACGGAAMPSALLERYLRRGAIVCNGMGMTETGPTAFLMDPAHAAAKIGSVGKPQMLTAVRVVDEQGNDLPAGATGELWFRGPGITPGYWQLPAETQRAFSADGWLRSGDLGYHDDDGYYYIVGRAKDMYISGGQNVYPAEVENVLASHPAVVEAVVVGHADERWGEVGVAFLRPRPGEGLPPPEELTAYCRHRLAAYKVPKRFLTAQDFPRTPSGKVQKHLLEIPDDD